MDVQSENDENINNSSSSTFPIVSPSNLLNLPLPINITAAARLLLFLLSCFSIIYILLLVNPNNYSTDKDNDSTNNFRLLKEKYIPSIFGLTYIGKYTMEDNGINVSQGNAILSIIYRKSNILKLYRIFVTIRLDSSENYGSSKYFYFALSGNAISNNPSLLPSIVSLNSISPDIKSWFSEKLLGLDKLHKPTKGIDKSFNLPFLTTVDYWNDKLVNNKLVHVCGLSGFLNINTTKHIKAQPSFQELDDFYLTSQRSYNITDLNYQMKLSNTLDSINLIKYFKPYSKIYRLDRNQVQEWNTGWEGLIGKASSDENHQIFSELDYTNNELSGNITSSCGISLNLTANQINYDNLGSKSLSLSIIYIARSIAEALAFYHQLKLLDTDSEASRISIISLFMIMMLEVAEVFIVLIHSTNLPITLFNIGIALFVKFSIITLFQMKLIIVIYKSTHQTNNPPLVFLHAGLAHLLKKYLCMILALTVYFFLYYNTYTLISLPLYLCWVPQICLDIWKGQRRSMNMLFVYIVGISKMLLPLYIYFCPYSIFNMDVFAQVVEIPNRPYSFFVFTSTILQLFVMSLQRLIDPRWVATYDFLPKIYNYERNLTGITEGTTECVICMYEIQFKGRNWSVTPCDHIFHTSCLREWTRVRLECPNCRRSIPAFPL